MADQTVEQAPSSAQKCQLSLIETLVRLAQKEKSHTTIYLVNGIKLEGFVLDSDATSLLFSRTGDSKQVFAVNMSAVASFCPRDDMTSTKSR